MKITRKNFIEVLERLDKDIGRKAMIKLDENNLDDFGFDSAYQTAVAVFVTQKGSADDVNTLRDYLTEAYSGSDLGVTFV